jgi:membrane-associated protease RseP (regulator of RpoE activity)
LEKLSIVVSVISTILSVILVHESGHYIMGRILGYRMPVFSIGMGPRAKHLFTYAGTQFIVSWLPIGGYVLFDDIDKVSYDAATLRRTLWRDVAVYAAGVLANLVSALVVSVIYYNWMREGILNLSWLEFWDESVDLFIFASIFIACVNMIPLPPLDGGRIAFALIEIVRNRPIHVGVKESIFVLGTVLVLIYTVFDWSFFIYMIIFD